MLGNSLSKVISLKYEKNSNKSDQIKSNQIVIN
jgi:hypothetical protein